MIRVLPKVIYPMKEFVFDSYDDAQAAASSNSRRLVGARHVTLIILQDPLEIPKRDRVYLSRWSHAGRWLARDSHSAPRFQSGIRIGRH